MRRRRRRRLLMLAPEKWWNRTRATSAAKEHLPISSLAASSFTASVSTSSTRSVSRRWRRKVYQKTYKSYGIDRRAIGQFRVRIQPRRTDLTRLLLQDRIRSVQEHQSTVTHDHVLRSEELTPPQCNSRSTRLPGSSTRVTLVSGNIGRDDGKLSWLDALQ